MMKDCRLSIFVLSQSSLRLHNFRKQGVVHGLSVQLIPQTKRRNPRTAKKELPSQEVRQVGQK